MKPEKNITTLVPDIYAVLNGTHKVSEASAKSLGKSLGDMLASRLGEEREPRLSPSSFGTNCDRKLWLSINHPDKKEPLAPWVRLKFLYGDILEKLVLWLAKEAGHKVEGEQDVIKVGSIEGSRDAVIDGVVVDVKSANGRSMEKFKNHELEINDPFGYLDQLGLYLEGSKNDPKVEVKNEAAFLAVNKDMGHLVLDRYKMKTRDWEREIEQKKAMIASKEMPKRAFTDQPEGMSGNRILALNCSYCDFKKHCWSDANDGAGLRTFIYSTGPKYLTKVSKVPNVPEVSNT